MSKTQTENEIVISWSDDHWNTEYDQLVSSHLMISWPSASCCPANEMVVRSEGENLALLPFFPLLRFSDFPWYNVSFIFFLAMLSSFVLYGLFRVLLTKTMFGCLDGVFFILIFPFSLSLLCCLLIFLWFLQRRDLPQITGHFGPPWCNPQQTEQKEGCPPMTRKQTGVLDWVARLSWSRQVAGGRRKVQVGCCWHREHLKS